MERRTLIRGSVLLILIAVVGVGTYLSVNQTKEADVERSKAPDFTLTDLAGVPVTLSESNGRIRVVNLWASWSPYSRTELPMLAELAREYDSVEVYALSRDVNEYDARAFLRELSLEESDIRFVLDPTDSYFRVMSGFNMPETLVLDTEGGILLHIHGPATRGALEEALTLAGE